MTKNLLLFILTASALLAMYCTKPLELAGGTEGGNNTQITGIVVDVNGNAVESALVKMRPTRYLPSLQDSILADSALRIFDGATDSAGGFHFEDMAVGSYLIEAQNENHQVALLQIDVITADSVYEPSPLVLKDPSSIAGTISLPPGAVETTYVEIFGMERQVLIDSQTGEFLIEGLPAGSASLQISTVTKNYFPVIIENITVLENDSLVLDKIRLMENPSRWGFSKQVTINTAILGSDMQDVFFFPLLIKLNSVNFDFGNAASDGSDIRFFKSDNTPLPYEIEEWDPSNQVASIWLLLDTLTAGGNSQIFNILYGNPEATSHSNSELVFDTANGFAGIWHLSEQGNVNSNGYSDATANHNHGTGINFENSFKVEGLSGQAQNFNGLNNFIQIPHHETLNFGTGDFTFSAIIKTDSSYDSLPGQIFSKRNDTLGNYEFQVKNHIFNAWLEDYPNYDSLASSDSITLGEWNHLTLIRSSGNVTLFIDGVPDTLTWVINSNINSPSNLFIGIDGEVMGEFFKGIIDEVRLSKEARSMSWVKYYYENLKPGSSFLSIE